MSETKPADLHPLTQQVLSRRRMLATGGAAAVSFFGITFLVTGCSSDDNAETDTGDGGDATTTSKAAEETTTTAGGSEETLYDQLGGYESINLVMVNFVNEQVAKDDRINAFFATTDLENLIKQLSDFTANATGGPEEYNGLDMKTAHEGLGISEEDFNALVEDLAAAMTYYDVPPEVQEQVVAALAPLQPDIVEA